MVTASGIAPPVSPLDRHRISGTTPAGSHDRELASGEELVDLLRTRFGLDLPEAAGLWPAIEARHAALFG